MVALRLNWLRWLSVAWLGLLAGRAQADTVEVRSQHERRTVGGERGPAYLWLQPQQMMVLEVRGPTHLGLRVRQVLTPGRQPAPVDLTVVRDDVEQATVRFRLPQEPQAGLGGLSGRVLVKIEVPAGKHLYRLLVSGPQQGVVLKPFTGAIRPDRQAIVATPAADRVQPAPTKRAPRPRPPRSSPPPEPQPPEPREPVVAPVASGEPPRTVLIQRRPAEPGPSLGPGARTAGSLAGALLIGAGAMLLSASAQADRAEAEPIQLRAGVYFDRARRCETAAAVMGALAGAAVLAAIVFYTVEEPRPEPSASSPSVALFRF